MAREGRWLGLGFAIVLASAAPVGALTAHLITGASGPTSLVNQTPGPDLHIGTVDDVTETGGWGATDFGPNSHGAASFALVNAFDGGPFPTWTDFTNPLFVDGTLEFTPDYNASTATDLVVMLTGGSLRSTAEFGYNNGQPGGRGEATTAALGGTAHFNPNDGSASITLTGSFAPSDGAPALGLAGQTLTAEPGKATIVLASQFGSSGNAYVDSVLVPLVPAGARAIVLVEFTGRVSGTTSNGWASRGVLAAYTTDDLGCTALFPLLPCEPPPSACKTFDTCQPLLAAALPDPKIVARKSRKTARKLTKLLTKGGRSYTKGTGRSGRPQKRLYGRACRALDGLGKQAARADQKGRLEVALEPITSLVARLRGFIPGCS